ncbi:hypothetical protein BDZ91DRAFT_851632 [Kalaharituber pfeilii]|nr:hypothetical protein BDZ91DRAFT_851632 [Kalaharituber pfeilii]
MLLLQHLIIYKWQYTSMKNGDTGALEHCKDFLCVLFHGGGNHNYAQELLEQAIDRKCVWTSWYRQMWRENILQNLTGRPGGYVGVDEICEIAVRHIKQDYNPRGTWQSKRFHLEDISRNIMSFRDLKFNVHSSAGAQTYGSRHSRVDVSKDRELLIRILLEEDLFTWKEGRTTVDSCGGTVPHRIKPTVDCYYQGMMILPKKVGQALEARASGELVEDEVDEVEVGEGESSDEQRDAEEEGMHIGEELDDLLGLQFDDFVSKRYDIEKSQDIVNLELQGVARQPKGGATGSRDSPRVERQGRATA